MDANEYEQELLLKEQRISYWERFGVVPAFDDLMLINNEAEL